MALKQTLTKAEFEALPDATRELYKTGVYVADGDNWKLDAEGVEDVSGLKSALQKERDAAKAADAARKALEAKFKDVDPEKYAQLLAEAETKENDDLKSKGKIDEIIEKHNAKLAALKKEYEEKITAKDTELDRVYIDLRLRKVFEDAGVIADRIDDAVELTKPRAKRNDKGELTLHDQDGSPLDVSAEVYAKELLKEKKPWLYQASGAGGSGAQNGTNGGNGAKTITRKALSEMSPDVAMATMKEAKAGKVQLVDG